MTGSPFHLERTLRSGQCFRWTVDSVRARGVVDGTVAVVRQEAGRLSVDWEGPPGSPDRLLRHLGADQPLAGIEAVLGRDRVLRRLLLHTSGIAIMRQDPWECLVSYVISAFNNIPKIQLSVRCLARRFGDPIPSTYGGAVQNRAASAPTGGLRELEWTFPSPERLADANLPALRSCVLGYRAPYVRALARLVADGTIHLDAFERLAYERAREALLELPGVGDKVADCVLLFAFGQGQAFPVDVWVQRAVERWYFRGRSMTPREIRVWARDRFGPHAGYAQQHLFAGVRRRRGWSA